MPVLQGGVGAPEKMWDNRKATQPGFPGKRARHLCVSPCGSAGGQGGIKAGHYLVTSIRIWSLLSGREQSPQAEKGIHLQGKEGSRDVGLPASPPPKPVPGPASQSKPGRSWLRNGGQVQAEPANPLFLLSWIPVPGEPPSFVSVTPHTTSSVLIQWRVRPGKGRVFPGPTSEAEPAHLPGPVSASEGRWRVRRHRVVGVPARGGGQTP